MILPFYQSLSSNHLDTGTHLLLQYGGMHDELRSSPLQTILMKWAYTQFLEWASIRANLISLAWHGTAIGRIVRATFQLFKKNLKNTLPTHCNLSFSSSIQGHSILCITTAPEWVRELAGKLTSQRTAVPFCANLQNPSRPFAD